MRKFLTSEVFRFAIVGVVATIIHYGVYWFFLSCCNETIAYSIGYVVSLVCNYFLTSRFTFRKKASVKNGLGFALSHLVNYLIHTGLLNLYLFMGIDPLLAPWFVFPVAVPINFLLLRFVFKK